MTAPSTDTLLAIARATVARKKFCFAITVSESGDAEARVVQPRPLTEGWTVDFATTLSSRKAQAVLRTGRLTLAWEDDEERAYVTLTGAATIVDDIALKRARWSPESFRWYPNGPDDPDVVYIRLAAERIELWNAEQKVMPEPKGQVAAVLVRDGAGWRYATT